MATRAQQKKADMAHFLDIVIELNDMNHPIHLAFQKNQITQVTDVLVMDEDDILKLKYPTKDDKGKTVISPLPSHFARRLIQFKQYVAFKASKGTPLAGNWSSVTREDFEDFFTSMGSGVNTPSPSIPHIPSPPKTVDKVKEFKKGIKHDVAAFPELASDGNWHSWKDATIIQAHVQGVETKSTPLITKKIRTFLWSNRSL